MKTEMLLALVLAFSVLAADECRGEAFASRPGAYAGAASMVRPRHVVVVGFDGLGARFVRAGLTPTMDRLADEGAWTLRSRSILPSSSACNWHSFFTCSASEQHGFNDWNSRKPVVPAAQTLASGRYPDVFAVYRRLHPQAEIGFIYQWSGVGFCIDTNVCNYVARTDLALSSAQSFREATALACSYIRAKKPDFLSVCFGVPDGVGHEFGWDSPQYTKAVADADAELAKIVDALADAKMLDETVLVVFSDHGGRGKGHGCATLAEMERPSIFWGKGVKRGHELAYGGAIYDDGATVAALLGIVDPPVAWIGRPRDDAFAASAK